MSSSPPDSLKRFEKHNIIKNVGQNPYREGYYDNKAYLTNLFRQGPGLGPGLRYPSTNNAPFVKESPYSAFQPSSSNASTDSDIRTKSAKRKYIIIAILASAILVIVAIVAAVLIATLAVSDDKAGPITVEKIVRKGYEGQVTLNTKTWTDAFNDKNSTEYKTTEADFIAKMDEKFRQSELAGEYDRTSVTGFQKGSVQVLFVVILKKIVEIAVFEDGTSTTTTTTPSVEDILDAQVSNVDFGIEISTIIAVLSDETDFSEAVMSDVNECDSNPCGNGGTCNNGVNKFTCTCMPGYSGETCEAGIDECESNPCLYGGICNDQLNGYTCRCVAGVEGTNCEINIDECDSNPCQNTGTCVDGINQYTCNCIAGYEGDNCETDIDECDSNPCQNAGTCVDGINQYSCNCIAGYEGDNCETDINNCETNPCDNGGTCTDDVNDYKCTCEAGWTGKDCDTNINECDSDPCKNGGTCEDGINKYLCNCKAGYAGDNCETDIDDCETNPCENGGTCIDAVNDYSCGCVAGWTGKTCDINIDDCDPNPCENGATCTDAVNNYTCSCDFGWTGRKCDINIDDCDPNPCENGATCTDAVNNYTCSCDFGWTGRKCDINNDDCDPNPCENGATCTDAVNNYTCSCDFGWTGRKCDINIDDCDPNPCENGATCTDAVNNYTCSCDFGWTGRKCDINIDDCDPNPCENEATCTDAVNNYTCSCLLGWTGKKCNITLTTTTVATTKTFPTTSSTLKFSEPSPEPTSENNNAETTTSTSSTTITSTSLHTTKITRTSPTTSATVEYSEPSPEPTERITNSTSSTTSSSTSLKTNTTTQTSPTILTTKQFSEPSPEPTEGMTNGTSSPTTTSTASPATATMIPEECDIGQVLCNDGMSCIISDWLCNGMTDCWDGSDEFNCTTRTTTKQTSTYNTSAATTTTSFNLTTTSPVECNIDEVLCLDGTKCIPSYWKCDGIQDCMDNSDEFNCTTTSYPTTYIPTTYQPCLDDEFKCIREVQCVKSNKQCDGIKDCRDGTDEWYNCTGSTQIPETLELEVRLMDKDNDTTELLYGRVEVRRLINGEPASEFGTICDDSWDSREAVVLCRSLNASDGGQHFAYGNAMFGHGNGPIWLRNFHCKGEEDKLEDCSSSGFGRAHCSHTQDAAISCGIDRRLTVPPSPSTNTSTTSSITAATMTPPRDGNIRLMDGENCLQGRVEIFYNGQWGTICDDYFYENEARAVCSTLGFGSNYISHGIFGYGTGSSYGLYCNSGQNSVWECDISLSNNCSHYEDIGVYCYGDPDILCKIEQGIPSVNCTFDDDICAYNLTILSGDLNWIWQKAVDVDMSDAGNVNTGRLMLYDNYFGSELDSGRIESPSFRPTANDMKVEYYYQLRESSYKNLMFILNEIKDGEDVIEHELWNSVYLHRDQERRWLYKCVSLTNLNRTSYYTLMFTALRGPYSESSVAIDDVHVTDGLCAESLLDGMCDFNRLSNCGMTVECSSCDRTKFEYKWMWTNGTQYSRITSEGFYMLANSTFCTDDDETVMSFALPNVRDKATLRFWNHMSGVNGGSLDIQLYEGDYLHSTLIRLSGDYGNKWTEQCVQLPSIIDATADIKIKFKAVCGQNSKADIAIDNVKLDTGECPHPVIGCVENLPQCGWITNSTSKFAWNFSEDEDSKKVKENMVRLVNGSDPSSGTVEIFHEGEWGRVCDDSFDEREAKVVCRMLGYPTDVVRFMTNSFYGGSDQRIWLDDLMCSGTENSLEDCARSEWGNENCGSYEHASVTCYGKASAEVAPGFERKYFELTDPRTFTSSPAIIMSREFKHEAGEFKFMFEFHKTEEGVLTVWYHNVAANQTQILDKIIDAADAEQYCVDLPTDLKGQISLGITAFKMSHEVVKAAVKDFALVKGSCKESLAKRTYTFENDHRLYAYAVLPLPLESSCKTWLGWTRVSASTIYKMPIDHTFLNETGHFMYGYGPPSYSELQLQHITEDESKGFCSLQFYYFKKDETADGGLYVNVNDIREKLAGIPKVSGWFHGCVSLVDTCGDVPGPLNVTFEVADIEAGIDDIHLSGDPCPANESDVTCDFRKGDTCGYYMDPSTWRHAADENLTTSAQGPNNFLVSQLFDMYTNSCISIEFTGLTNYTVHLTIVGSNGETVDTTGHIEIGYSINREMQMDVHPGRDLRLYFDAYSISSVDYSVDVFTVHYINATDTPCIHSGLGCNRGEHRCGDLCLRSYYLCDGERQCVDGSDEKQCECNWSTFNCTINDECVHRSLQCDDINDCTDGSDEMNCGPSVNCSFWNRFCGYKIHNAVALSGDGGLGMTRQLAYISSPEVFVDTESCLVINLGFCRHSNIRVSTDDGAMYTILYQGATAYGYKRIFINIDTGNYKGFVIETQSVVPFTEHFVTITNITLFDTPCQDPWTRYENTTLKTVRPNGIENDTTSGWTDEYFTSGTTTSATTVPLPDDFPLVEVEYLDIVTFEDSVTLSCKVTHDAKYELIMFWKLGYSFTLSREDDIMVGDDTQTKYTVIKSQENGQTIYNLTVNDVTEDDANGIFVCVADVVGYQQGLWPSASTVIRIREDGCLAAKDTGVEKFCRSGGYNRITLPTVSGLQTIDQVNQTVSVLQEIIDRLRTYTYSEESYQCITSLHQLACGLHVSHCKAGNITKPVCREHCQEIAGFCMKEPFDIVSNRNEDLEHYCKYLPSVKDEPDCTEVWLGCGVDITLGADNTPSTVRLRSEKYPHASPSSSQCNYTIRASPHYLLNVTALDILLTDDCTASYLEVNGAKLCSSNVSYVEQLASEGVFNVTLFSNIPGQNTGLLLTVSQVLPMNMCDIIEVDNFSKQIYDSHSTIDDSCSEWLFYSNEPGYNVDLVFTALDGCLEVLDKDLNEIQEICNPQETELNTFSIVRLKSSTRFTLHYRQIQNFQHTYDFTIESVELREGDSDNEGKVFITRSDGRSGYMCGNMNDGAADVICKMAGFGSPALLSMMYLKTPGYDYDKKVILYDLYCDGDEDSLVNCHTQQWNETCTDYSCSCYSPRFHGVSCPQKSVSCNMTLPSVCGYEHDTSVVSQTTTSRFGEGLYMIGDDGYATNITSPDFKYVKGDSISFEYSLDGISGGIFELYLKRRDDSKHTSVWKKAEYSLDGRFIACVPLPKDFINEEVQLVFHMTKMSSSSGNIHALGLHAVSLKPESCPARFPEGDCSLENVEVCDVIFSQVCFDDNTGRNVWQIKNNTLRGDSKYALQNMEYPITFTVTSTMASSVHFTYSQTGTGVNGNDLKLMVRVESRTSGTNTIFSDHEFRPELESICLTLPSNEDETFNISFVMTKYNSEGVVFLDDIAVNDEYCPHPVSCDFENNDACSYSWSSTSDFFWLLQHTFDDHTSAGLYNGYVMEAYNSYIRYPGESAILTTPLADVAGDIQYKCLSFFYKANYKADVVYKLEVNVFYPDTNETIVNEVEVFFHYMWQEANIEIDPTISSTAQFSFIITNLHGQEYYPMIIDDVRLLPRKCVVGLQDLERCDFNNPGFCGYQTNCTTGSGYSWQIYSKTNSTEIGPSTDAGFYMYVDSSLGEKGHESYLWFKIDLTDTTVTHHYQFSYHMSGDGNAKLETFYRNVHTNTNSEKSIVENIDTDMWLQSYCYKLPEHFQGEIYFYAVRGDSIYSDIAIDNVRILDGNCQNASVTCDFQDSKCGYMQEDNNWSLKDGYISTSKMGVLHIPTYTLEEDSCIRFEFESDVRNILALVVDTEFGLERHNYTVYSPGINVGRITHFTYNKGMTFAVPGNYYMKIDRVTAEPGRCLPIACKEEEFACDLQCIPQSAVCDRRWDCKDGQDENDCGFSIPCEFTNATNCGYDTVPDSPTKWTVLESHIFQYNETEHTVSGGMLFTKFENKFSTSNTSASSTWHKINETKCLRFSYLGTVPSLTVAISDRENGRQMQWTDQYADMTPTHWRPAQMTLEPGIIMVTFTTSMLTTQYTVSHPNDDFVAIREIELLSGGCEKYDPPACPDEAKFQCDNGSLCYNQEMECDKRQYCVSGSDESPEACGLKFTISCDFENSTLCGWKIWNLSTNPWKVSTGFQHQIPPFDHTKNDKTGHFLHSVNWYNDNNLYERATVTSPTQLFQEDGCIAFWYYLNSTATQPNALSAQILVSLIYTDSDRTKFLWYDYVDRPIETWIQGGVPVLANQYVKMNVTSIQFETYSAWPGVVALDDVMYHPGQCEIKQECHARSFECKDSRICLPEEFICDGKDDCLDSSDEADCNTRPNDALSLAGGDGSYGQLRYFTNGSWRAVCEPDYGVSDFIMTEWVCEQLGYKGNSELYKYKLLDIETQSVKLDCVLGSCIQTLDCYSYYYVGIKCSNTACFSGERRCSGTGPVTCVAKGRFCDGLPDCPNNSDEKECYCKADEDRCRRTRDECLDDSCETCRDRGMFECQNHQCIDKSKRCDGMKDCSDGFDEYRCVQIDDYQVIVNNGSQLLPVCYNNIGRDEADMLCSLSGKGVVTNGGILHGNDQIDSGIILTETDSSDSFLQGLHISNKPSCYPLMLHCELPECGTAAYMDSMISPVINHGNKAVLGEWPYQGVLRLDGNLQCGCSWIGGKWAVTAAHCVENAWNPAAYNVIFGTTFSGTKGLHGQEFIVAAIHTHPMYTTVLGGYDIALLELAYSPNIDNYTRPICLGTEESWQDILDLGDKAECYITGFGANELYQANGQNPDKDLAETKVGIVDRDKCKELWSIFGDDLVSNDGVCLENREPYQPACYGDSGGPYVCKNKKGRWEQFGVASYGGRECKYFVPIVYFRLATQLEWIEKITEMNFETDYGDTP